MRQLSQCANWQAIFSKCTRPRAQDFLRTLHQTECSYKRGKSGGTSNKECMRTTGAGSLILPRHANACLRLALAMMGLDLLLCGSAIVEGEPVPLIRCLASSQPFCPPCIATPSQDSPLQTFKNSADTITAFERPRKTNRTDVCVVKYLLC